LRIDYELTTDDLLDFNMYHANHSETVKKALTLQRLMGPVLFMIILVFLTILKVEPLLTFYLPFFIIMSILWVIFYPKYFRKHIQRYSKKMLTEGKSKGITGKHTLTLTDNELIESNESRETKTKWASVQDIVRSDTLMIIYTSAMGGYIIPLRSFESKEKEEEFLNHAKSLWKGQKVD